MAFRFLFANVVYIKDLFQNVLDGMYGDVPFWLLQLFFANFISSGTGNKAFEEEISEKQQ